MSSESFELPDLCAYSLDEIDKRIEKQIIKIQNLTACEYCINRHPRKLRLSRIKDKMVAIVRGRDALSPYGQEVTYTLDAEELDALKAVEKARLDSLQAARSEFEKCTGYTREEKRGHQGDSKFQCR
ncbi:hypothetical protein [Lancefieldella rimae]